MTSLLWTTYALLWLTVGALVLAVTLIYRQFGLVYMEPRRRLDIQQGPDIGRRAPSMDVVRVASRGPARLDWVNASGETSAHFVLFGLPSCEVCRSLVPEVDQLPAQWPKVKFVWVEGAVLSDEDPVVTAPRLRAWDVVAGHEMDAHRTMDIAAVPFGLVIGADGAVLGKGLINRADDVLALLREARLDSKAEYDTRTERSTT